MASKVLQGDIVFERGISTGNQLVIKQAPPISYVTLEMLANPDVAAGLEMTVSGREINFGGLVTYRVTGWDDVQSCLVLERIGGGV